MRIAVAGGGLGGLSAALALAQRGCRVDVVERAPALGEAGAGVQLSPNATRVLRSLGVLAAIEETAVRVEQVRIRRWRDGAGIAEVPLGAVAEQRYGAPFLVAHRADVQAALLAGLTARPDVSLTFGQHLSAFAATPGGVAVTLESGHGARTIDADGLVGADGLRSAVRAQLVPGDADGPRFSGRTAWRSLIPAAAVTPDLRRPASQLWLGPHAHLVHYPVRCGAMINVVAVTDGAGRGEAGVEGWSTPGDPAVLQARVRDWSRTARDLIAAAPEWRVWPLFERPALASLSRGAVTLLGDAAHPMLPFLAQGAAQAIEDGWALARAVGSTASFTEAARIYQEARLPVATRVQRESSRQARVYHLAGPFASVRDLVMRTMGSQRMLARYDWLYGGLQPP